MNIQITSRKFKAKDSLKEFINAEVSSLSKFNDDIMDVNVILSYKTLDDSQKTAEVVVQVPGKKLTVNETTDEFKKSVLLCVEKMQVQLKKLKGKRLDSKRKDKLNVELLDVEN